MWSLVVGCSRSILHQDGFGQPKSHQQIRGFCDVSVSIGFARAAGSGLRLRHAQRDDEDFAGELARAYHPAGEMMNQGCGPWQTL
jgi:hypothetical protein